MLSGTLFRSLVCCALFASIRPLAAGPVDIVHRVSYELLITDLGIPNTSIDLRTPALNDLDDFAVSLRRSFTNGLSGTRSYYVYQFDGTNDLVFSDSQSGSVVALNISTSSPSINNAGEIAFSHRKGTSLSVYSFDGSLNTLASGSAAALQNNQQLAISDDSTSVFNVGSQVYLNQGGLNSPLISLSGSIIGINSSHDVAFQLSAPNAIAILPSGGSLTTISGSLTPSTSILPSFNDLGQVLFAAGGDIYLASLSDSPLLLVDIPATWVLNGLALNDVGGYAYLVTDDTNVQRLYRGNTNGSLLYEVLNTTEVLDGDDLYSMKLGPAGLNNHDSLAFTYSVAFSPSSFPYTGELGVAVIATIPEPTTFAYGSVVAAGLFGLVRRARASNV